MEYFYRHYGEYDPAIAQVATWLNFRLKNEFKTQQAKFHKCAEQTIQTTDPEDDSRDLFAMMVSPSYGSQAKLMKEEIEHWIAEDRELQTITIKNRPEITAQGLLQKRFVEEGEWSTLARDYGTSIATLSSFYERQCRTRLIQFVEANFDFSPPDTPINPCEHLRGLSKQKRFEHLNFHDYLSEWVKLDPQLRTLTLRGKPEITARIVLEKLLITIQHPRQGLVQVAEALQVNPVELERFYEFRLMSLILEVVHKSFRNSR